MKGFLKGDESTWGEQRALRSRGIKLALITSVVARLSGVFLQVISLPIAAASLGAADFAIYAMLGAILAALALSNLGMGQVTTLHMSRALAEEDKFGARAIFVFAVSFVGGIAFLIAVIVAALILYSPLLGLIFSQQLSGSPEPVDAALFVCAVFVATQILSVIEAAQLAQQRQHTLNLAMAAGTFIAAVCVWWASTEAPSVYSILIAVHLPVIIARIINAVAVWVDLRPQHVEFELVVMRARLIVYDGLRFFSGTTVANFLCHPLSILAVGVFASPIPAASYSAVMNAVILASVVFGYVVSPISAALPEAQVQLDQGWIRRTYKFVMLSVSAYALLPIALFSVFGSWLFDVWYGGVVDPQVALTTAAGLYVWFLGVERVNFAFLSSLGLVRLASMRLLVKGVVSAFFIFVLAKLGLIEWVIWMLLLVNMALSLVPLGFLVSQTLAPKMEPSNV